MANKDLPRGRKPRKSGEVKRQLLQAARARKRQPTEEERWEL